MNDKGNKEDCAPREFLDTTRGKGAEKRDSNFFSAAESRGHITGSPMPHITSLLVTFCKYCDAIVLGKLYIDVCTRARACVEWENEESCHWSKWTCRDREDNWGVGQQALMEQVMSETDRQLAQCKTKLIVTFKSQREGGREINRTWVDGCALAQNTVTHVHS